MWEKSEKHLALGLLFLAAAGGEISDLGDALLAVCAGIHCLAALYYAIKE